MNPEDKSAADDITEQITGGCFPVILIMGFIMIELGIICLQSLGVS